MPLVRFPPISSLAMAHSCMKPSKFVGFLNTGLAEPGGIAVNKNQGRQKP